MATYKQPHRLEDCTSIIINNPSKWKLFIHSKAGERTGIWIDNLQIVIDGGLSTYKKIKALFVTHKHCDHSLNIPTMISRRSSLVKDQQNLLGTPVYIPLKMKISLLHLMKSILMLSDDNHEITGTFYCDTITDDDICRRQGIHPFEVKYGDVFTIPGIQNIQVEVFKAYHTCNCNGYGFSTIKSQMKPEFVELTHTLEGKQKLRELAKENTQIREQVLTPELAFYCDSTIQNLTCHNEWTKYPVVICECTEIDPSIPDNYEQRGHTHITKLLPILQQHTDKQFILIHTSMKYTNEQVHNFESMINDKFNLNIIIWHDDHL